MIMKRHIGIEYVRGLLRKGRSSFTRPDAAVEMDRQGASLSNILTRLEKTGWIMPVSRGFYAVIDSGSQAFGFAPPQVFLDDWARHRGFLYYVAGVSAAEIHGAAHQRSQVYQVVTDHVVRPFQYGDLRVSFFRKKPIMEKMWEQKTVPSGYLRVSTAAVTAYDLLYLPRACRSLSRVATILVELGEALTASSLAALNEMNCETPPLQRLGWLLDHTGWKKITSTLHDVVGTRRPNWQPLEPQLCSSGNRNARWHIIENTDIQPDI
jgi:predicted transcriptional regulator of viral defense system